MDKKNEISRQKSRMVFQISQMPPLKHWPDKAKAYDVKDSEVCRWLMDQPLFMEWVFQKAKDLGAIEYNGEKWTGVNYQPPES